MSTTPKTVNDLRDHLFATLDALRDKTAPMDLDRARAISDVAQTIINSARVEVEHLKALGSVSHESGFLAPGQAKPPALPGAPPANGITSVVHQLKG